MPRLAALLAVLALAAPAVASPRDELLRAAPQDAAMVFLVQNARDHVKQLADSPFAKWFPTSTVGTLLGASADLKAFRANGGDLFDALGVTPEEILDDIAGDAFGFAYSPAPPDRPKDERAVFLFRPRKPEALARLVAKLNDRQKQTGEIKGVLSRKHAGGEFFERRKNGDPEFYCFRGGVFAFSSSEADIKAVLERDLSAPCELSARVAKLGVADSLLVVLVNPRALDGELKAKAAAAKDDEKVLMERFTEGWKALDAAAFFLKVNADLEAGVSVQFRSGELTPRAKTWLTGARAAGAFWAHVPDDALFAVGGRFQAKELLDDISSLLPDDGKKALRSVLDDVLGPLVGRENLPAILAALGPDWGVWVGSPLPGQFLPTAVGSVHVGGAKEDESRALLQAVEYGFLTAKLAYNSQHADQLDLRDARDGDVVIKSLVGPKAFPPGVAPSFALKGGYLLVASSPDAVRSFAPKPGAPSESVVARFSATSTRKYLQAHRAALAKFLAESGAGNEKELLGQFEGIALALEPLDRVEIVTGGDASGMRVAVRVKFVKPLK